MTKDELSAALVIARKIQRLQAALADLRGGGIRSPGASTPVQGGPGAMSSGQLAAELEQEITTLTRDWEVEREIIRRGILRAGLPALEERVLLLRYAECRAWMAVAATIGYSRERLMQINREALHTITHGYT